MIDAGEVLMFNGVTGRLLQTLTSAQPQTSAGFGSAVTAADFDGAGTPTPVVGTPYQNADIAAPDGDIVTHLQIGQIEIQ